MFAVALNDVVCEPWWSSSLRIMALMRNGTVGQARYRPLMDSDTCKILPDFVSHNIRTDAAADADPDTTPTQPMDAAPTPTQPMNTGATWASLGSDDIGGAGASNEEFACHDNSCHDNSCHDNGRESTRTMTGKIVLREPMLMPQEPMQAEFIEAEFVHAEPTAAGPLASEPIALASESIVLHPSDTTGQVICGGHRHWSLTLATRRKNGDAGYMPDCALELVRLAQKHTLARYVDMYLQEEVRDMQSPNTLDAKSRDLLAFVVWFVAFNGHGRIAAWQKQDTAVYLNTLEHEQRRAPTTVNRALASLRHFARWVHERPEDVFAHGGLPTRGAEMRQVDEPDCKKLTRQEVHQLFKAADFLVRGEVGHRDRPMRNRAILALLYYTGLRVSELVALRRDQYRGNYLLNVARKGKSRSKGLYVVAECRRLLDDYLNTERLRDDPRGTATPLIIAGVGERFMSQRTVQYVLNHIADAANKGRDVADRIVVHPHRLRHTFGAEFRARSGSDTETAAALGHTGLRYVGRYVRKSPQEREAEMEGVFQR